ncbi:MAG: hypothetical protein IPM53_15465 [Anaerolineaceae bacterium]|nr:hypothetical protein [Anaerolineaceae bacterium]
MDTNIFKTQYEMLDKLQENTYGYFIEEYNPENGLVRDKSDGGTKASIAATGFALSSYPVVVSDGLLSREEAAARTLTALRFFANCQQGQQRDASGYRGFFYHYLDLKTGKRYGNSELSTMDTALLMVGVLLAQQYFKHDNEVEAEIRRLAGELYGRIDWQWAMTRKPYIVQGWRPRQGFIPYFWQGYDESLLMYILALGSETSPIPPESYKARWEKYVWRRIYDYECLYAGSLFIHQVPHIWIDFRDIQDEFMRARDFTYFENSRHATYIQQEYAIRNPWEWRGYGVHQWGITASDGPGYAIMEVDEIYRVFYDYVPRGAPFGPDDGTIAPWVTIASLPFAPEIVIPTIEAYSQMDLEKANPYGYKTTFNQTFPAGEDLDMWVSPYHFGINQGPVVLMIENFQTGLIWELMRQSPPIIRGLRRAGFTGGWLEDT